MEAQGESEGDGELESSLKQLKDYTLQKVAFASHEVFMYKKRLALAPFTLKWPLKVPFPQ